MYERRIEIDDPVAEAVISCRRAIVRLVGMQDVALAGKAVPPLTPEAKGLYAGKGYANRIGVVAVRCKGLASQMRLDALDTLGARRNPDAIAQPFKTASGTALYRRRAMTGQTVLQPGLWRPILTLILASAVIMGSPGPSTMSATAVAAAYGFRRSLMYGCGLILGTIAVLVSVAAGVVTVVLSIPHGAPVLVAVSAVYMLYLAFRIATAPPLAGQRDLVAVPAFAGGFLLAIANPKAYLAIAAVFAGTTIIGEHHTLDAVVKTVLLGAMIVVIHLCWLTAGASLSRVLHDPASSRIVNAALAAGLVATTAMALFG